MSNESSIGFQDGTRRSIKNNSALQGMSIGSEFDSLSSTSNSPMDTMAVVRQRKVLVARLMWGQLHRRHCTSQTQVEKVSYRTWFNNHMIRFVNYWRRWLWLIVKSINWRVKHEGKMLHDQRSAKKVSMTPQVQINQTNLALFIRDSVSPSQKILPQNWQKYRDEKDNLCQLILKKMVPPRNVSRWTCWDVMRFAITNEKQISNKSCLNNFKVSTIKMLQLLP